MNTTVLWFWLTIILICWLASWLDHPRVQWVQGTMRCPPGWYHFYERDIITIRPPGFRYQIQGEIERVDVKTGVIYLRWRSDGQVISADPARYNPIH